MKRSRQLRLQIKITLWGLGLWWKTLLSQRKFASATELQKAYRQLQESQKRNEPLREHFLGDVRFYVLDTEWFRLWPHAFACTSGVVLVTLVLTSVVIAMFL